MWAGLSTTETRHSARRHKLTDQKAISVAWEETAWIRGSKIRAGVEVQPGGLLPAQVRGSRNEMAQTLGNEVGTVETLERKIPMDERTVREG